MAVQFGIQKAPWRSLPLVCGLMLAVLCPTTATLHADEAADDYNLAVGLYKQSRWKLSADGFREFLGKHPEHTKVPYAKLYLGLTLINLKQYGDARDTLREYIRQYPRSQNVSDAMYRVAECSYLLEDLRAAESEFSAFLTKHPDHDLCEWALPYHGDVLLRRGKPREAAALFRQSLETHPKGRLAEDAKFSLARSYETLDEKSEAIDLYRQLAANRAGARAAQSQLNLGALYFDAEKFDEAAKVYSQLEVRFPESSLVPTARLNAGSAFYQLGQYTEAGTQFEKAASEPSQAAAAHYWLALSHKARQDYTQAAEILDSNAATAAKSPLAMNYVFQRADCELRLGRFEQARELFLDVVKRQPKGELADDGLHFAAESALLSGDLDGAESLLDRFSRDYPSSAFRLHSRLLRGRLLDARGGEASYAAAIEHFETVIKSSSIDRTQNLARFQLARTLQRLDKHDRAIATLKPVLEKIDRDPDTPAEWLGALVLAGSSYRAIHQYDKAIATTSAYLKSLPEGPDAAQALADRLLSQAQQGDDEQARADFEAFKTHHASSAAFAPSLHELAELTYDAAKWDLATEAFEVLAELGPESPYHAAALSGWAWALFKSGQFDQAADVFGRVAQEHPDQRRLAAESAYQRGQSLQSAEKLEQAVNVYQAAFQAFAPSGANATNADEDEVHRYAFLAGLQAARVLRMSLEIERADAAYQSLLDRFERPQELDKLLDEWALLNYEAGRFKRSDEIFRRLVRDTPDSELADDARLSLAESQLVDRRYASATKAFQALVALSTSDDHVKEVALYHLVEIGVEQRDWQDVQRTVGQFIKQFPDSRYRNETEFRLAESRLNLNQVEPAQRLLLELKSKQAEMSGESPEWFQRVWVLLAETYFRQKQYEAVEETLSDLRSLFPDSPVAYQGNDVLGRTYINQAKFDRARSLFQSVLDDPHGRATETAAKCQFFVAETYLMQKEYEAAQREYLKVYHLHKYPQWQALALFQAARCDEALQQWDAAVETYESLLKEFADSERAAQAKERLKGARQKAAG